MGTVATDLKRHGILYKIADFKLGTLAYDNCYSDLVTLEQAVQYVRLQSDVLGLENVYQCNNSASP